jgi:subtilase family serine protease
MTRVRAAAAVLTAIVALGAAAFALSAGRSPGRPAERTLGSASGLTGVGPGLSPAQIQAAYGLGPLLRRGIDGAGQTIVIVDSFGSPTIRPDLAHFDKTFGLPAPPAFRVIQPAGKVPAYTSSQNRAGWAAETSMDVEWAHVLAPGASILLVETPVSENEGTSGFPQIVAAENYVIGRHLGDVISMSFDATEQTFPSRTALTALRSAFTRAAAPGYRITVVAGSGDDGASGETYDEQNLYDQRVVAWPASDPLVTAVGGTQLDLAASGARRQADVAWSDSGGGLSEVFGRPAFQDAVRGVTGAHRGIPDISMDASCASGTSVYESFPSGPGRWTLGCGTSLATPLFAAVIALADQEAGHPLGLVNPGLYALAGQARSGLVDVTSGSNSVQVRTGSGGQVTGFRAAKGYDLVSGLGTVYAALFVPALVRAVEASQR